MHYGAIVDLLSMAATTRQTPLGQQRPRNRSRPISRPTGDRCRRAAYRAIQAEEQCLMLSMTQRNVQLGRWKRMGSCRRRMSLRSSCEPDAPGAMAASLAALGGLELRPTSFRVHQPLCRLQTSGSSAAVKTTLCCAPMRGCLLPRGSTSSNPLFRVSV